MPPYTITVARPRDVPALAAIELAAAKLLADHVPPTVLNESTDEATLRRAQAEGRLWVALDGDVAVGFAHVEMLAADLPHLEELDVHPAHGRRGIGAALVREVRGSVTNVIGLPLAEVAQVLARTGVPPRLAAGRPA